MLFFFVFLLENSSQYVWYNGKEEVGGENIGWNNNWVCLVRMKKGGKGKYSGKK